MRDLAFELSVPADPAFRPLAAEAAGQYGETLGMPADDAGALAVSTREAVDLAAGASANGTISVAVEREGDSLELTVSGGGTASTLSRTLAGTRST